MKSDDPVDKGAFPDEALGIFSAKISKGKAIFSCSLVFLLALRKTSAKSSLETKVRGAAIFSVPPKSSIADASNGLSVFKMKNDRENSETSKPHSLGLK